MRPLPFLLLSGLLLSALAGCARFPEVEAAVTEEAKAAPRPVLTDNDVVLVPAGEALIDPDVAAELTARSADLRAQAAEATGPILTPEERAAFGTRAALLRAEAARVAQEE